jgi:hypothetical protein
MIKTLSVALLSVALIVSLSGWSLAQTTKPEHPQAVQPQAEHPKVDPKVEPPKVDPKAEHPKVDPKAEHPKAQPVKPEHPKSEHPK